jgi:hypothetical protein
VNWEDGTSYSRNDKVRTPSILRCKINTLEIVVHRIHGISGWYFTCRYLDIKEHQLNGEDLESCEHQSIVIVKKALYAKVQEIRDNLVIIEEF